MSTFADSKETIKSDKNVEGANEELSEDFKHHVSERVKLYEASMKGSASPAHLRNHNNNIRHVVPVGILIVLCTLYLTTAAFQSNYNMNTKNKINVRNDGSSEPKTQQLQTVDESKRLKILEKLLEYKDLCTELDVFTKDLRWINNVYDNEYDFKDAEIKREQPARVIVDTMSNDDENDDDVEEIESDTGKDRKEQRRAHKAVGIKNNKVKTENYKNNRSSDDVHNKNNDKKEQPTNKKPSTAEPIIYLFALVFIYLLLKAASDINQHYKSQNKGDKRLRRCSLQSYAQTHKQDRRASKGSPKKKLNRELFLEMRSKSVDRFNDIAVKKSETLTRLRKYTSFDEKNRLTNMQIATDGLRLLSACEAQGSNKILVNRTEGNTSKASNRRCSVPISLTLQRPKVGTIPAVPTLNNARRTSLSVLHHGTEAQLGMGAWQLADHGQDTKLYEVKRRVRMINRH